MTTCPNKKKGVLLESSHTQVSTFQISQNRFVIHGRNRVPSTCSLVSESSGTLFSHFKFTPKIMTAWTFFFLFFLNENPRTACYSLTPGTGVLNKMPNTNEAHDIMTRVSD